MVLQILKHNLYYSRKIENNFSLITSNSDQYIFVGLKSCDHYTDKDQAYCHIPEHTSPRILDFIPFSIQSQRFVTAFSFNEQI